MRASGIEAVVAAAAWAASVGLVAPELQAQSAYCALTVRTVDEFGQPRGSEVHVKRKEDGTVFSRGNSAGIVEFCDLPKGRYQIEAGLATCGKSYFDNVRIGLPITRQLTLQVLWCIDMPIISDRGCFMVVRLRDENGSPIPGAEVRRSNGGATRTDRWGRLLESLKADQVLAIEIRAKGYNDVRKEVSCGNEMYPEQEIRMSRSQPPN
jgi:hypothetical protein